MTKLIHKILLLELVANLPLQVIFDHPRRSVEENQCQGHELIHSRLKFYQFKSGMLFDDGKYL